MIPVAGKPFLEWLTRWLIKQGFEKFIYSTGYLGEKISAWCEEKIFSPPIQRIAHEEKTPLGTGGGVLNCLDLCDENILILNGDSLLLFDVAPIIKKFASADGVMLGSWADDASRFGSLDVNDDGFLKDFREKQPGSAYINGGFYLLRKKDLRSFPRDRVLSMEMDVIPLLLKKGAKIAIHPLKDAPFIDIGLPETVAQAGSFIHTHARWF